MTIQSIKTFITGGVWESIATEIRPGSAKKEDGSLKPFYQYAVKPLHPGFAGALNQTTQGFAEWKTGEAQDILGKAFPPFGLKEGQLFKEYDLIYVFNDLLFWGARNIDGRGFDTEENRPTNLQIPLVRRGK